MRLTCSVLVAAVAVCVLTGTYPACLDRIAVHANWPQLNSYWLHWLSEARTLTTHTWMVFGLFLGAEFWIMRGYQK